MKFKFFAIAPILVLIVVASSSSIQAAEVPTRPSFFPTGWTKLPTFKPTLKPLLKPIAKPMIYVTPSAEATALGERILNVDLMLDGQMIQRLQAISGKPDAQVFRVGRDSRRGSAEPLPQGTYAIGVVDRGAGLSAAIGNTFIPITPLFQTSRRYLGIHRDADRNQKGGEGTLGCIGLLSQQDIDTIANFVTLHRASTLVVDYSLPQPGRG